MPPGVSSSLILSMARELILHNFRQLSEFLLSRVSPHQLCIVFKTEGPSHLHSKNTKLKLLCGSSCVMMDSVSLLLFMGTISTSLSFIVVCVITTVRVNC